MNLKASFKQYKGVDQLGDGDPVGDEKQYHENWLDEYTSEYTYTSTDDDTFVYSREHHVAQDNR